MDKRQEILDRLNALRDQAKEVKKELDDLDYTDRLANAIVYRGKYYKEIQKYHDEYFRGVYVYNIDLETCECKGMEISYWSNKDDWFSIQNEHDFKVRGYDDDEDTWIEITKEEFDNHYSQVHSRINKAYMTNDPTFGTHEKR